MTPEGKIKHAIDKMLKQLKDDGIVPLYFHKPVQNGMGMPTLDYIGCCDGCFFAIEAKAPGKEPTKIQGETLNKIRAAWGKTFVIDGEEGIAQFAIWAHTC